jgi:hypothetical protein
MDANTVAAVAAVTKPMNSSSGPWAKHEHVSFAE